MRWNHIGRETEGRESRLSDGLYLHIDMGKTGKNLERLIKQRGYSVKDIQYLLHLSCPQPIYRWMRGQVLPSVDHLFVLAKLLQVHMEELLIVAYETSVSTRDWQCPKRLRWRRMIAYSRRYLCWEVA